MEKQLKQFFRFLEVDKKASNNTLQSYKRDLKQFKEYLEENNIKYSKVTEQDVQNYLKHLEEQNKKPSTISRTIASIRAFFFFFLKTNNKIKNLTENIQSLKIEKRKPCVLKSEKKQKKK